MSIKTLKNGPQKLLIIGPDPFISQSSPDHSPQPTAQNWFFILWNLGTRHLFSYLCLGCIIFFWISNFLLLNHRSLCLSPWFFNVAEIMETLLHFLFQLNWIQTQLIKPESCTIFKPLVNLWSMVSFSTFYSKSSVLFWMISLLWWYVIIFLFCSWDPDFSSRFIFVLIRSNRFLAQNKKVSRTSICHLLKTDLTWSKQK